jgi:hypothetical protein
MSIGVISLTANDKHSNDKHVDNSLTNQSDNNPANQPSNNPANQSDSNPTNPPQGNMLNKANVIFEFGLKVLELCLLLG